MIKVLDLSEDSSKEEIADIVAAKLFEAISGRLGSGFTLDQRSNAFQYPHVWRSVKLDLSRWDKLDVLLDHLLLDIAGNNIRSFLRRSDCGQNPNVFEKQFEKDGVCFQITMEFGTRPIMSISYLGRP